MKNIRLLKVLSQIVSKKKVHSLLPDDGWLDDQGNFRKLGRLATMGGHFNWLRLYDGLDEPQSDKEWDKMLMDLEKRYIREGSWVRVGYHPNSRAIYMELGEKGKNNPGLHKIFKLWPQALYVEVAIGRDMWRYLINDFRKYKFRSKEIILDQEYSSPLQ